MKLLLDSHIALWIIYEPERVARRIVNVLRDPSAHRLLSDVTLLELTLKLSKGKLEYSDDLGSFLRHMNDLSAEPLPIRREHIVTAASLPHIHGDPFDRLLIAQAIAEGATFVTDDHHIRQYGIAVL